MVLHYKTCIGTCEELPSGIYVGQIFEAGKNLHLYFSDRDVDTLKWKFEVMAKNYLGEQEDENEDRNPGRGTEIVHRSE